MFSEANNPRVLYGPPHTYKKIEEKQSKVSSFESPIISTEVKKIS